MICPYAVISQESLDDDMLFLLKNGLVGPRRDFLGNQLSWHRNKTPGSREKIEKGTIYKYERALLTVCMLYWNDFVCGDYTIPDICTHRNSEHWHFPNECLDLNGNAVAWPKHVMHSNL